MPSGESQCCIAVDGEDFFFFDEGQARVGTVMLLHGFPDTPHSFATLARALADEGYRVLRPYLPGYAPNHWAGHFGIGELCQRLFRFIDELELGPVHLVGHDWGAALSYALLREHPEVFAASATMSVPHPLHLTDSKQLSLAQLRRSFYMLFLQVPWLPELWSSSGRNRLVETFWRRWSPSYELGEGELEVIERCLRSSGSAPFDYYRSLSRKVLARNGLFGNISTPLLYLHGEQDGCIGAELSFGQEKYFPAGYKCELIAGAGHFLHAEAPEEVAELLLSWFQSYPLEQDN